MLVPTIILCLVSSTFACSAYTDAAAYFKSSNTLLRDKLSWETPTEPQANYAALLQTLMTISYTINDGVSFDEAYAQYANFFAAARGSPNVARDQVLVVIKAAEEDTLSARNLIDQTCGSEVSADCDCKVEEAIKDDAKLQAQATLLLEFPKSGWSQYQNDWTTATENNTVGDYLADNQDKLKAGIEEKSIQLKQIEDIESKGYSN